MLINSIELEKLDYTKSKAHDLSNQLFNHLPYTTKQCYIDVTRNGKTHSQYKNLRSVESSDVIRMCNDKIERAKTNNRVNVKQWLDLKSKLENIYKNA